MTAITSNTNVDYFKDQTIRELPVKAATRIYRGSLVGTHYVTGLAQPFVPTNVFRGIAFEEADNTDGTAGLDGSNPHLATDTAGRGRVQVITQGDFVFTLSGASADDAGKAVYALDSSGTVSLTGHPDAYIGRIQHVDTDNDGDYSTTTVVVRLDPMGKPTASDGSLEWAFGRGNSPAITGVGSSEVILSGGGGFQYASILGLGVTQQPEGTQLAFDNTSEAANASIETNAILDPSKGITFDATLVVASASTSDVDVDFGLGAALTTATRANMDAAGMTNHVRFHIDGGSDNILAESDDATTDVSATDTTIDNDSTTDVMKRFVILVATDGTAELWIEGTQVLTSTTFSCGTAVALAGFVNAEKAAGTATAEVQVGKLRVAGVSAA